MGSISVVITTLDDRLTMRDCLDGVLGGGTSVSEVLVVDRGSVDGTVEIIRRAGAPVRLIERPGWSVTDAISDGVAEAKGDVLAVVPSRAIMAAGAIEASARAAALTTPAALTAAARSGRSATVDLRPVGTTAFGRAAAAIVGGDTPSVEVRGLTDWRAPEPSNATPVGPSSYLVADTMARLAVEAFGARTGWRRAAAGALVGSAVGMALFGRGWVRVAIPLGHAAASAVRAWRAGREPGVAPHRAFLAAEIWDWGTGAGRLVACGRAAVSVQ